VLAYFVIRHRELLSDAENRVDHRFAIEPSEDEALLVVAIVDLNPHPFSVLRTIMPKLNLHMVASVLFLTRIGCRLLYWRFCCGHNKTYTLSLFTHSKLRHLHRLLRLSGCAREPFLAAA
jgi:hypothetical protein